jgi:hypothetical protein
MAFDDSNSFFNHSDFDFAESVREDEPQEENLFRIKTYKDSDTEFSEINNNNIQLILFNNEAIVGDKIHGAIKIYAENYLPQGRIELVLESTLKVNKPVQKTQYKMKQYLNQYRNFVEDKKLEEKLNKKPNI